MFLRSRKNCQHTMLVVLSLYCLSQISVSAHPPVIADPSRRNVISNAQWMQYELLYVKWNSNISTCNQTIFNFNNLMQTNAFFPYPNILDYVLDACYKLDSMESDLFADNAWKYITSKHPKHCALQPYQVHFSKLLKVYALGSTRTQTQHAEAMLYNAQIVMNDWIIRYRSDPHSLRSKAMRLQPNDQLMFTQLYNMIVWFSHWSVKQKQTAITFYYHHVIGLGIQIHVPLGVALSNIPHQQIQASVSRYKEWRHTEAGALLIKIDFQNNFMNGNRCDCNQKMIFFVLDACAKTDDVVFGETVWNYIQSRCNVEPNQILFSALFKVYQRQIPINVQKCVVLFNEWLHSLQHNRASLLSEIHGNIKLFGNVVILNQMLKIIVFRASSADVSQSLVRNCFNRAIALGVSPDQETIRVYERALVDSQSYSTCAAKHTMWAQWISSDLVQPYLAVIRDFEVNIMASKVSISHYDMVAVVFDACAQLRTVEFAEKVWNYVVSDCALTPNRLLYSKMLRVYQLNMKKEHVQNSLLLFNQWVNATQHHERSLSVNMRHKTEFDALIIIDQILGIVLQTHDLTAEQKQTMIERCCNRIITANIQLDARRMQICLTILNIRNGQMIDPELHGTDGAGSLF
eukprot:754654_1